MRRTLLVGMALGAVSWAQGASAQTGPTTDIEEIIVTAQRRGENLQDVPVSVSAVTGSQLQKLGVENIQDLTLAIPGLTFGRSTTNAQPTIRGIGSKDAATGSEGSVAIYLDGVYQAQANGNVFELNDISQIEVLRGPQGTLYGRNAMGGAINIVTRTPSFSPTLNASASYGRFDSRRVDLYASGPIVGDTFAAAISYSASKSDGYIRNVFLDRMVGGGFSNAAALKALYAPSDSVKIQLNLRELRSNMTDNIAGRPVNFEGGLDNPNSSARTAANPGNIPINNIIPTGYFETAGENIAMHKVRVRSADLHGDFDIDFAKLSTLIAYKRSKFATSYDSDLTPLGGRPVVLRPEATSWYLESVLTSKGEGPLQWILGANFFDDLSEALPQYIPPRRFEYGIDTRAYSAFGEVTYEALNGLFLTGGLRYSWERKRAYFATLGPSASPGDPGGARTSFVQGEASWDAITPRAVVRYEFSDKSNVYLSYSKGFKSGAFNASSATGATSPVNPEEIKAVEGGVKVDFTRSLRVNAAAFHYDYTDLQVQVLQQINGGTQSFTQNAADARIWGLELEAAWRPMRSLELHGSLAKLDTKFTDFPNAIVNVQRLVNGVPSGATSEARDVTGNQLIRSPKLTANLDLNYVVDLFGGKLTSTANIFRSSKVYYDVLNAVYQPAYTVLNASVSWRAADEHFYLRLSGRNLTNEKYLTNISVSGNGYGGTFQRPRSFTVTIGYDY